MLPCHSYYICGTWRSKEVGCLKLSYGGKGKNHRQEELLWGATRKLPTGSWTLTLNYSIWDYLPISASCGIKRYMHYIRFLLTKNSQSKVWINFPFVSFFIYIIIDFFINLRMIAEWAFAFLNTAVIIFCSMYSLNIPHSNQNPSFFPV